MARYLVKRAVTKGGRDVATVRMKRKGGWHVETVMAPV
jgi:hypothetical protein